MLAGSLPACVHGGGHGILNESFGVSREMGEAWLVFANFLLGWVDVDGAMGGLHDWNWMFVGVQ